MQNTSAKTPLIQLVPWLLLGLAALFAVTVRCRLASFPMDRDEGEYAYAGQLLLKGIPPYKYAHNMKLPGTYLAYAGLMAVFGQTTEGVHWGTLAVNLGTILFLFLLTRQLLDGITAGGAAILYAVLSVSASVVGMTAHATHFVAFFGLIGTYVLWRSLRSGSCRLALVSGLFFGLALLMKQQGVFLIVFGAVCLTERALRRTGASWCLRILSVIAFGIAAAVPYLLTCWWLWSVGVWDAFKFWTLDYAAQYVQVIGWDQGMYLALAGTLIAIGPNFLLWLLGLIGLVATFDDIFSKGRSASGEVTPHEPSPPSPQAPDPYACWFMLGYLAFSIACVLPGLIFRSQYYVVMLPPLALFGAVGCRSLGMRREHSLLRQSCRRWWHGGGVLSDQGVPSSLEIGTKSLADQVGPPAAVTVPDSGPSQPRYWEWIVLVLALGPTIFWQRDYFFWQAPLALCRQIYGTNPFPESPIIARYLHEHTTDSDTVAVIGSEPQLYFLSERRSATGYIYTYPLVEPQPFARRMQEEMIREIEQAAPAFIVDVHISMSWARRNNETLIFDWKNDYLQRYYSCVGIVEIIPNQQTVYRWGRDVSGYAPRTDNLVVVYQKR
jgi:hypothetical protein